jgi:protoheme IX farnesyltransferase
MQPVLNLIRIRLSFAVAFSALAGFILCVRDLNRTAFLVFAGLFFLSCSAAALNQWQESKWDLLMNRTENRPLPATRIKPQHALFLSAGFGIIGFFIFFLGSTSLSAILGIFTLFGYNAVYTPLKRKTRYAVFIGALVGAVPPVIGWAAAGGNIFSPEILTVSLFIYLWQVPHFLLLLLRFDKEYQAAGFPMFFLSNDETKRRRIIFIWLSAAIMSTWIFPLLHIISGFAAYSILLIINSGFILFFYSILFCKRTPFHFNSFFRFFYAYQVLILLFLIASRFGLNGYTRL